HRKIIETKIGNAAHSLLLFIFTRKTPPSHQSKDNPLRQTRPLGVPADLKSAAVGFSYRQNRDAAFSLEADCKSARK
uniref:hypothetical protein n=1 Tax=Prevotella sp. TaxID=59823 RepID=UPI003FF12ACF